MATLAASNILARVRSVVQDGVGSVRTITADTYRGGVYERLESNALAVRVAIKPRVEPRIVSVERHEASPPVTGSFQLLTVVIEIRLVRPFAGEAQLDDTLRDTLSALAAADGDVLQQALGWPGNMDQPSTGLVSGLLRYEGTSIGALELNDEDQTDGSLVTIHRFNGIANVATAIA